MSVPAAHVVALRLAARSTSFVRGRYLRRRHADRAASSPAFGWHACRGVSPYAAARARAAHVLLFVLLFACPRQRGYERRARRKSRRGECRRCARRRGSAARVLAACAALQQIRDARAVAAQQGGMPPRQQCSVTLKQIRSHHGAGTSTFMRVTQRTTNASCRPVPPCAQVRRRQERDARAASFKINAARMSRARRRCLCTMSKTSVVYDMVRCRK